MDLGIAGRKAIVCASSRGLGRGCAEALAAAGLGLGQLARSLWVGGGSPLKLSRPAVHAKPLPL